MTDEKRKAFKAIFSITKSHEGGYSNSKADKGGETYCGISRKFYPDWDGWLAIDRIKAQRAIKWNETFDFLDESVVELYYWNIWKKYRIDEIQYNQDLIFDMFVNHSPSRAAKIVQKTMNELKANIVIDGILGSKTITQLNEFGDKIRNQIIENRIEYFKSLNDPIHIEGWLTRARSFFRDGQHTN